MRDTLGIAYGATIENARGTAYADMILGNSVANLLEGGEGNDTLDGGLGNDTINGGGGSDIIVLDGTRGSYIASQLNTTDVKLVRGGQTITVVGVEFFEFTDGVKTRAHLFTNPPTAGPDVLTGTAGPDLIDGLEGDDTISGLGGNDTLQGGAGDDSLDGGAGLDRLVGGADDDTYVVDVVGDVIVEAAGEGTDLVKVAMTSGVYTLAAYMENAEVTSTGAVGVTGNDEANDLKGNAAANTLKGNAGNDSLQGLAGNDVLEGGEGNDTLDAGLGSDKLMGGAGDDLLIGGLNKDTLTGGLGADTFVLDAAPISTANADSITDFNSSEGDKIQLSAGVFGVLGSAGDAVSLGGANLTYNVATGALVYDADGVGGVAGITIAILGTRPVLTAADLELIA